jgi:tRNA G18 (ribose-2'-O)-methylase SpoU
LIRSANAFGVKQIFILGENKKILKKFFGSQGTVNKSDFLFFDDVTQLRIYCQEKSITIVGIEIGEGSKPIDVFEFKGDTLFVLGNEGQGMNTKQKELCKNSLVYIPQFSNKTASLNVACAGSIIFHYFAKWAKYDEMNIVDEKFEVDNSIIKNVSTVKDLSLLKIEDESV